jgi:MoaA/NifB/PqqE/SkfB family radical SAM enzyme
MTTTSPYASNKALCHLPVIQALRRNQQPPPTHLQLILSDLCNQDCAFCAYRMTGYASNQLFAVIDTRSGKVNNNPNRMIPTAKALEILADCRDVGVKAVQFTGGGEPTVHPDHCDLIQQCLDFGLDVALVTNGVKLGARLASILLRGTWVRISIDAAHADTYGAIRRVSPQAYGRVLSNVQRLVELRDTARSSLVIGIGFVVTRDNWAEVIAAGRIARDLGVDSFRISAVFQPDNEEYFSGFRAAAADLCLEAESLSTERFQVVNMFRDRLADLQQGPPDYVRCAYQHFTTYIGADLNVYRCCNTAYNERGLIGSIVDRPFRELWESEAKRRDFEAFDARGCERCQFNAKNREMNALIDFSAVHPNFV